MILIVSCWWSEDRNIQRCIFDSKIILLALWSLLNSLSAPAVRKTQYFVPLSFNSTLELIDSISRDLQKLLKYLNDIAIVELFRIPLAALAVWASVFTYDLALYLKGLKSVVSSLE